MIHPRRRDIELCVAVEHAAHRVNAVPFIHLADVTPRKRSAERWHREIDGRIGLEARIGLIGAASFRACIFQRRRVEIGWRLHVKFGQVGRVDVQPDRSIISERRRPIDKAGIDPVGVDSIEIQQLGADTRYRAIGAPRNRRATDRIGVERAARERKRGRNRIDRVLSRIL